jgi:hypothetical protein
MIKDQGDVKSDFSVELNEQNPIGSSFTSSVPYMFNLQIEMKPFNNVEQIPAPYNLTRTELVSTVSNNADVNDAGDNANDHQESSDGGRDDPEFQKYDVHIAPHWQDPTPVTDFSVIYPVPR